MGAELVDGLVIKDGDYKLVKTRFSAFFNTHLHSYLQGNGVYNLVIAGNTSFYCSCFSVLGVICGVQYKVYGMILWLPY